MNRGSHPRRYHQRRGRAASMRPRFMNRGSDIHLIIYLGFLVASMRPRFMNRGSDVRSAADCSSLNGFNEAPIHESGKLRGLLCRFHRIAASMRPRFMNRGSATQVDLGPGYASASMRPRFMNRGSLPRRLGPIRAESSFNEAPIHESGKCGDSRTGLVQRCALQ